MTGLLLYSLWRQALLLSAAVLLLWALHRPLLRLGASAAYASWLLLPLLLLTPALPRPAREPLRLVLQAAASTDMTELPVAAAPATDSAAIWLALWLAGAA